MLIRNRKAFNRGLLLMVSFIGVFIVFFLPVFPTSDGGTSNGLVFADHLFNTLAKGSANFFEADGVNSDTVERRIERVRDSNIELTFAFKEKAPERQQLAIAMLESTGVKASFNDGKVTVHGNLHTLLSAIILDAHAMYHNDSESISGRHGGANGQLVMSLWWQLGSDMIRPLQAKLLVGEANAVNAVMARAIEPAYNFYGIQAMRVSDNIPLVAGFLIFYVIYTMWYGFAIFDLFEGIGLTMKKSVKQEV